MIGWLCADGSLPTKQAVQDGHITGWPREECRYGAPTAFRFKCTYLPYIPTYQHIYIPTNSFSHMHWPSDPSKTLDSLQMYVCDAGCHWTGSLPRQCGLVSSDWQPPGSQFQCDHGETRPGTRNSGRSLLMRWLAQKERLPQSLSASNASP